MLHQRIISVFIMHFLFAVQSFAEEGKETSSDSDCVLTDIESHLSIALQIIQTAKLKIPEAMIDSETGNQTCNNSKCFLTDIKAHLKIASQVIETAKQKIPKDLKEVCKDCGNKTCKKCQNITCNANPLDCSDIFRNGLRRDGLYDVWPQSKMFKGPLQVYCDMESNGGGWTVIQRRGDYGRNQDYFFRGWNDYKIGFGDKLQDFWIGNDYLFALTNQRSYELRVNLTDWYGATAYATYDEFWISDENQNYTLHVNNYNGTAGDSLKTHNGMSFSTRDRINTKNGRDCAKFSNGAWWYHDCADSNLNGLYLTRYSYQFGDGVIWNAFTGMYQSLRDTVMKIRPIYPQT